MWRDHGSDEIFDRRRVNSYSSSSQLAKITCQSPGPMGQSSPGSLSHPVGLRWTIITVRFES